MSILHGSYHKPASRSHLLTLPPSIFSFPRFFSEMSRKREMKIKSGEGELREKKRSRGDETPSCSGSPFIGTDKGKHQGQEWMRFFLLTE